MTFTHVIRPRYGEVDMQGIVFNAWWLAYFDDAAVRFLEALGFSPKAAFADHGKDAFTSTVVKAVLEWKGPATFDDTVEIRVCPSRLGRSSWDMHYIASVRGLEVCTCTITYVCIEPGTQAARPIPAEARARLQDAMGDD